MQSAEITRRAQEDFQSNRRNRQKESNIYMLDWSECLPGPDCLSDNKLESKCGDLRW